MLYQLVRSSRLLPVRRLERSEADLVGFAGPLVLQERQHRIWVLPWRSSGAYVVTRRHDEVVLEVSAEELAALGVTVSG